MTFFPFFKVQVVHLRFPGFSTSYLEHSQLELLIEASQALWQQFSHRQAAL